MDEMGILTKIKNLELRVDALTEGRQQDQINIVIQKKEIEGIKEDMVGLKTDIISIVAEQTAKTWELINKGGKLVFALIMVITALAGIKLLPELLNFLL